MRDQFEMETVVRGQEIFIDIDLPLKYSTYVSRYVCCRGVVRHRISTKTSAAEIAQDRPTLQHLPERLVNVVVISRDKQVRRLGLLLIPPSPASCPGNVDRVSDEPFLHKVAGGGARIGEGCRCRGHPPEGDAHGENEKRKHGPFVKRMYEAQRLGKQPPANLDPD